MKKLIQTTVDQQQVESLGRVIEANACSEANAVRLAVKVGLEILEREIHERKKRILRSTPKQVA
jgi:hypothetical protein